ncbi:HlyC/CorC family transporter [bacterium]|nr:HlyC/CorC family transporter [bacterium]
MHDLLSISVVILSLFILRLFVRMVEVALEQNISDDPKDRIEQENQISSLQFIRIILTLILGMYCGLKIMPLLKIYFPGVIYSFFAALFLSILIAIPYAIIGELVPRGLALNSPEALGRTFSKVVKLASNLARPLLGFLNWCAAQILKIFGVKPPVEMAIAEASEEAQSDEESLLEEHQEMLASRIEQLSERRVDSIMTPRTDILWIEYDDNFEEVLQKVSDTRHTYFPVFEGSIDNLKGVICAKDLWKPVVEGHDIDWRSLIKPALLIPGSTTILHLLKQFRTSNQHFGIVIDEYGGLDGLVSLHDAVTAILGLELVADSATEEGIVERADGTFLVPGSTSLEDFFHYFEVDLRGDESNVGYQTVGGYVMSELGHVPRVTEVVEAKDLVLEVIDMDGFRVDKVLVKKKEELPKAAQG